MAYSATVTGPTINHLGGRDYYRWSIAEVEASSTSEFVISGAPQIGTIVLYSAQLVSGAGTTINPILGRSGSFTASTMNHIATNTTTAARINDSTNLRYGGLITTGSIFVRSTPNSVTANHVISTEIEIVQGIV